MFFRLSKKSFSSSTTLLGLGTAHAIIASFGNAKLVRKLNGIHELVGGNNPDHAPACEWCSFFAHDMVFTGTHCRDFAVAFAV